MSNDKVIPMMVPRVGGQPQPFDISEAKQKHCEACGNPYFDACQRLGLISGMSPRNITGKDVLVKFECYLCRSCGHEYGQPVPVKA